MPGQANFALVCQTAARLTFWQLDEAVDDIFKPGWVQTGDEMMNFHSISCF